MQCFASRASLPGVAAPSAVAGLPGRYLDSWLMSPELCCNLMARSAGGADMALVAGRFEPQRSPLAAGGSLDTLCDWLGLPKLAVVDVGLIDRYGLPERPQVDAVLLNQTSRHRTVEGMVTDIETLWGVPVIGTLEGSRADSRRVRSLKAGSPVPKDVAESLGNDFRRHWRPEAFARLVNRPGPLEIRWPDVIHDLPARKPVVAVAYDEAFFGYFPSTLDQLELLGAQVVDFSPLRDESLPSGTDIVYVGCGRPEAWAAALSENHCMKAALRSHVACGGRIYAEVGGAAYLGQALETPAGETHRMCGILPAVARFQEEEADSEPVEIAVEQDNWLTPGGTRLRGYRTGRWRFESLGCRLQNGARNCCQLDLLGCNCVVGSMMHLHFAARPDIFSHFFEPALCSVPVLDPWRSAS